MNIFTVFCMYLRAGQESASVLYVQILSYFTHKLFKIQRLCQMAVHTRGLCVLYVLNKGVSGHCRIGTVFASSLESERIARAASYPFITGI